MPSADLQQIDISELKPGMFVVKVVSKDVALKVKTEGVVRTRTSIQNLKSAGVEKIWIDPDRCEIQEEPAETTPAASSAKPTSTSGSFEEHMKEAMALYDKAKSIQARMMKKIKQGQEINVEEVELLAQNILDSVFTNSNALLFMTKLKDAGEYLYQHSLDVSILITVFAKYLDFAPETIQKLAMGALLHDAGMINLPEKLLQSSDKFTEDDFKQIPPHVDYSLDIAASLPGYSEEAMDIIRLHHERLDGSGYPMGLKGDEINIYGRMAALVDGYCAMTSERPHKQSVSAATAFKIMRSGTPGAYDNDLMGQLIRCVGIFPVGTLVKLKSNKLALVTESNYDAPLQPKVGVFYSVISGHYQEVKQLDLASPHIEDEIISSVRPEEFNIDLIKFLRHSLT